jgi:hypothetical protein
MFTSLLPHEAVVHRRTGAVDRFGQPVDQNPAQAGPETGRFPCRLSSGRGGRVMDERSMDVFEVTYQLFAEADADVQEDDNVEIVDASTGAVLLPIAKVKIKETLYDAGLPHHLELLLVSQRGPI